MSRAESALIAHLVSADSLEVLASEGLDPEILPSEELRPVLTYAMDQYHRSGLNYAVSVGALRDEFADVLDEAEVDLEHEPEDSIEWAIDTLKHQWVHRQAERFNRDFAMAMAEAERSERIEVVNEFASRLVALGMSMESGSYRVELSESGDDILRRYEEREATRGQFQGLGFALSEVDAMIGGVRPGELAVMAGGPKVGKSWMACWIALQEYQRGRTVSLFTLENSVEMTLDRIAGLALGLPSAHFDQGLLTDQQKQSIKGWVEGLNEDPEMGKLWVLKPDLRQRTMEQMVKEAQIRRSDSLLIDQLTHVDVSQGMGDRRPKHEKIGDAMHILKGMISTGRQPMACVLMHQINREGVKSADKSGHLEMFHLAESSEVERTADFVFSLYASRDDRQVSRAKFQMLAARRTPTKHWTLRWSPATGSVRVLGEFVPEDA